MVDLCCTDPFDALLLFAKKHGLRIESRRAVNQPEHWRFHALRPTHHGFALVAVDPSPAYLLSRLMRIYERKPMQKPAGDVVERAALVLEEFFQSQEDKP